MEDLFPVVFQWFVLISTVCLAACICRLFYKTLASHMWGDAGRLRGHGCGYAAEDKAMLLCYGKRHLFFTARYRTFWSIVILAAVTRILLYGVAFLFAAVHAPDASGNGFSEMLQKLWQRSDAPHYMAIAKNGYANTGEDRVFLVFLPLYPMLTGLLSQIAGDIFLSGVLISLLSYIAACALIYEIALIMGQDDDAAFLAAKYAIFFPSSFFVNGTFSDGLFLLLTALFFHLLLRGKWIYAAIFGMLSAYTRYYGVLLAVPYAIECVLDLAAYPHDGSAGVATVAVATTTDDAVADDGDDADAAGPASSAADDGDDAAATDDAAADDGDDADDDDDAAATDDAAADVAAYPPPGARIGTRAGTALSRVAPILLIPTGTALFLYVNYAVSGNWFQFLVYQREHWHQRLAFFFDNMKTLAYNTMNFDRPTSASLFVPEIIFIILFIMLAAYGAIKKLRVSFLAYLGVYFLLSVSAYWLLSFPRYIFGALPVFPLMASLGRTSRAADALISFFCLVGLVFLTLAYTGGYHVY